MKERKWNEKMWNEDNTFIDQLKFNDWENMTWRDGSGNLHKIKDMNDYHLCNTEDYLRKTGRENSYHFLRIVEEIRRRESRDDYFKLKKSNDKIRERAREECLDKCRAILRKNTELYEAMEPLKEYLDKYNDVSIKVIVDDVEVFRYQGGRNGLYCFI